jgi:hypothetical protein
MEDERDVRDIDVPNKETRATSTIEARRTRRGKVSAEDWDNMVRALCIYRLGGMSFLDLLTAWEDILGIAHPPTTDQL